MKCPNCGVVAPAGAIDCLGCGVIFAKLKAKHERALAEVKEPIVIEEPEIKLPQFDRRKAQMVAAGVVILWIIGFGLYYRYAIASAKRRIPVIERSTVMMRDPATGKMRLIPVLASPVTRPSPE